MERIERVAIVGTAQSWRQTPWSDPGLRILSLNDAYQLGMPRADEWYDIHPLDRFYSVPEGAKAVYQHQIPPGFYVRPSTHKDWLSQLQIPLWLNGEPPAGWHHAQRFPKEAVEAAFGDYFTSTPAWMLAHAILRGAKEIHIYGIHLATQSEYVEQRPNFEFLLGRVLGPGRWTVTVANGLRRYATDHGLVVLPEAAPILRSDHQYAYQPRPRTFAEPIKWELHKIGVKRERIVSALKQRPWWAPYVTLEEPQDDQTVTRRTVSTSGLQEELWRLDVLAQDYQQQLQRLQLEQVM